MTPAKKFIVATGNVGKDSIYLNRQDTMSKLITASRKSISSLP